MRFSWKNNFLLILTGIFLGLLLSLLFVLIVIPDRLERASREGGADGLMHYLNTSLGFSLDYPEEFSVVSETSSGDSHIISFAFEEGYPWEFGVWVTETTARSAREWLDAQPKGSAVATGYWPVLRSSLKPFVVKDGSGSDTILLVEEYQVIDQDGDERIYGKSIEGIHVANGRVYKLEYAGYDPPNEIPLVPSYFMDVFASFRTLHPTLPLEKPLPKT